MPRRPAGDSVKQEGLDLTGTDHYRYLVRRPQSLTSLSHHTLPRTAHCAHTSERQVWGLGREEALHTCLGTGFDPEGCHKLGASPGPLKLCGLWGDLY